MRWPLRYRLWWHLHKLANRVAWHWAPPSGPLWASSLRIDHSHPLWRLAGWLGHRWIDWWIEDQLRGLRR